MNLLLIGNELSDYGCLDYKTMPNENESVVFI